MTQAENQHMPQAGVYTDPIEPGKYRIWDGTKWGEQVQPSEITQNFTTEQNYAPQNSSLQNPYTEKPGEQYDNTSWTPPPVYGFVDGVKAAFKNTFIYNQRASKSEYWNFFLFYAILWMFVPFLWLFGFFNTSWGFFRDADYTVRMFFDNTFFDLLKLLYWLSWLPWISLTVRRLKDANIHYALVVLMILAPPISWIVLLVLCLQAGTPHRNQYG